MEYHKTMRRKYQMNLEVLYIQYRNQSVIECAGNKNQSLKIVIKNKPIYDLTKN